ncbi:MAG: RsmB/NOP family class I SAM-dependent RNA methyltransferase, partial [Serpentinimonas sp.]|nr:RsmB/NOP family class I SAM-dependent RNA methyltransferase [Serpentinimonas sp.]
MHPHTLLELGSALLSRVLRFEHPADATVADFFRLQPALGSRERALLSDSVFAVLRDRPRWQWLAASHPGRTPQQERPARPQRPNHPAQPQGTAQTRALLLLAWTGPAERLQAACTPEEWSWRTQALAQTLADAPPACQHGLPDWLAEALRVELRLERAGLAGAEGGEEVGAEAARPEGQLESDVAAAVAAQAVESAKASPVEQAAEAEFAAAAQALRQPAALDLRVNLIKTKRPAVLALLQEAGLQAAATPHSPWGIRLAGKPALQQLPAWREGLIEVQDEGAQLLALLLEPKRQETVIDFCAGAGGKTLALGALLRNTGRLYAFDTSAHRLEALKPRLARSGITEVHTLALAHERDERLQRLAGKADRVLVDAPCSGLGTLRRQPDLMWRQRPAEVAQLAQLQG